ncbi:MAG: PEP/pyruvate-binding domain-containing protein [Clostridiales bacterium]|nr:PEP/pyruvate-binding domain-containing protein [Clostridiales bacterium]
MKYIVSLKDQRMVEQGKDDQLGGKAASLMKMCAAGFPVPGGYVILSDAWDGVVLKKGARKELAYLMEKLPGKYTYAVRSSAVGEDGEEHSFAGAYETRLDVPRDGILEAVENIAASMKTERVRAYAQNRGSKEGKIAVVIQRFVKPEMAGVLFTADVITGSSAKMVGNYVRGCGEQLVSGAENGQEFTFDAMYYAYHGEEEMKPYARKLYGYAVKLRNRYRRPMDIEWAVSGGKLYLLQARPITTLKRFDRDTYQINGSLSGEYLFSKTNVGEIFMCTVSPATYSVLEMICELIGVPDFIDNICGQAYCNISILCSLLVSFGFSKKKAYEIISDIAGSIPEGVEIPVFPYDRTAFLKSIGKMMFGKKVKFDEEITNIPKKEFESRMGEIGDRLIEGIRRQSSNQKLKKYWETHCNAYLTRVLTAVMMSLSLKSLLKTRQQIIGIAGEELANELCSNSSQNGVLESMKPMLALEDVMDGKLSKEEYMKHYGHRSVNEMELSCPYPYEDPQYLEERIRQHKESGICVHKMKEEQSVKYRKAVQEFKKNYPSKAGWLDKKLNAFAKANYEREKVRSQAVKLFCLMREFLLKASQLNGAGDGIFMLYFQETLALLDGDRSVLEKIPARKQQYEKYRSYPVFPNIIVGRFQPEEWMNDENRRVDLWRAGGMVPARADIKGYAGASGTVEGTVRILRDPSEAAKLLPGEILVTTATNIGWTTVFAKAAAIITDIGAPLSHAAIVAREFGIPAVVGCGNATQMLHTGDVVRVDGSTGVVTILE